MSGFRTLHREQIADESSSSPLAIWCVQSTPLLSTTRTSKECDAWRLWTAHSDGTVRGFVATERSLAASNTTRATSSTEPKRDNATSSTDSPAPPSSLDASALSLQCTHVLGGGRDTNAANEMLGCTQLCTIRNYIGDDDTAGNLVVIALGLSGLCRIWVFTDDWDDKQRSISANADTDSLTTASTPRHVPCRCEFTVANATGTSLTARIIPTWKKLVVAVACLDGTISLVDTGIVTPSASKDDATNTTGTTGTTTDTNAGKVLDTLGTLGSAIPLRIAWHPTRSDALVVGRNDGIVDILSLRSTAATKRHSHRLLRLAPSPTRAVAYTPDGHLLIAGNDEGLLCVWDVGNHANPSSPPPALVHFVQRAHTSWILDVRWLPDSRRFVTVGAEQTIHVWSVGQLTTPPLHTFHLDATAWTVALYDPPSSSDSSLTTTQSTRMVTGSDNGWLQVFSLAA